MKFLLILLGVILGVIIFLGIVALIIYGNLKSALRKFGFRANNMSDIADEMNRIKREDSTRARSISGITSLLLPRIRSDFPDFNEKELYTMTESGIRNIFNATEEKNNEYVTDLPLIKTSVSSIIDDYRAADISVHYDDVKFHKFALSGYEKKDGVATITVSTSVEYYYQKVQNGKVIEGDKKFKKQTRYQCNFIYIYDDTKVSSDVKVLGTNCPNCGASIKTLGKKYCEYCGTSIKEVNLKSWELASYEEY